MSGDKMPHEVVKPEKIVSTAAVLLEQALVIPAVFRREGIDQFKGADDDTINVVVEGVLPHRSYGWRNDRSASLIFDEYKERKVKVTFGGDIYSAVRLTDEQNDFDLNGWTKLARKQVEAIGYGLEAEACSHLEDAPYAYTVGVHEAKVKGGLIEARRVLNALRVPAGARTLLVGTNWESALLESKELSLAHNVGESEAVSALREATLGKRYGFNIVVAQELDPDAAVAMVDSAFVFATGAPSVPQSVPFGATASYEGVALTWIRDYETEKRRDRSVFNTYKGFRNVEDIVLKDVNGQPAVGDYEHFVRAIKLDLNGTSSYPAATNGTSDAAKKATEIANASRLSPKASLAEAPDSGSSEEDETP